MSTALLSDEAPLDPDDELLVAYLDGELDAKAESELMDRLLDDEQLNQRLKTLHQGWEWLDKLPDVTPSEKLVESTLELVVSDIVARKPQRSATWDKYRWPLGVALTCLAIIALSWAGTKLFKSIQYRRQLQDLELAENLDAFLHGSDIALMRQLASDPNWSQAIAAAREVGEFGSDEPIGVAETTLQERPGMLAALSIEDRAKLASRWDRFVRLDEKRDAEIRRTADATSAQPDAELLLKTMQDYAVWREKLPPELRDQIEAGDPKTRRAAIAEAVVITQDSTRKRSRDQLDDETVERIYFVLREILQQRIDAEDPSTMQHLEGVRGFLRQTAQPIEAEPFVIFAIASGGWQRGGPGRRPGFGGRPRRERPASLRDDELDMIHVILPEDSQDMLQMVSDADSLEDTLVMRNLTLRTWAEEAARRKLPRMGREQLTLLERYSELMPAERERIDLLPPKEMIRRLSSDSPWNSFRSPDGPPRGANGPPRPGNGP